MPAPNFSSSSPPGSLSRHHHTTGQHEVRKEPSRKSSKNARYPEVGSTENLCELNESCATLKTKKKPSKSKSSKRTTTTRMAREDSMASNTDSMASIVSASIGMTTSSSWSRSKRDAMSLTNRYEMASILDDIRTQKEEIEQNSKSCAEALKMKLDTDFEAQRQAMLAKWKAMSMERKIRRCVGA